MFNFIQIAIGFQCSMSNSDISDDIDLEMRIDNNILSKKNLLIK